MFELVTWIMFIAALLRVVIYAAGAGVGTTQEDNIHFYGCLAACFFSLISVIYFIWLMGVLEYI